MDRFEIDITQTQWTVKRYIDSGKTALQYHVVFEYLLKQPFSYCEFNVLIWKKIVL